MRLGIMTEGYVRQGRTAEDKLREILREAQLADEVGLDLYGMSEQHFKLPSNSTSSPEVMYAAIAQVTKQIRLQPAAVVLPLHHPLNMAERWAFIDILSNGRLDFAVGRGNTPLTADAFGVPVRETEARSLEALRIILAAWTQPSFEFSGQFFSIPELTLTPKPVQQPHPPLYYAAISPDSHETAGRYGMGLMTGLFAIDLNQLDRRIERYREGLAHATPFDYARLNTTVSVTALGYCAATTSRAREESEFTINEYNKRTVNMYIKMVERTGKQVDFAKALRFVDNFDALFDSRSVVVGDPDECIRRLETLAELGADEVMIRLDGPTHEQILESIRLLGTEVRPAVAGLKAKRLQPLAEPREAMAAGISA